METKRIIHSLLNIFEIWFYRTVNRSEIRLPHGCIATKNDRLVVGCHYLLKERFLPVQIVLIKKISLQDNYLAVRIYLYDDQRSCIISSDLDDQYMSGEWRLYDYNPPTEQQIAEALWHKIANSNGIEDEELFFIDFN